MAVVEAYPGPRQGNLSSEPWGIEVPPPALLSVSPYCTLPDPPIPPPLKDFKEGQIPKRPIPPPNILVKEGGGCRPVAPPPPPPPDGVTMNIEIREGGRLRKLKKKKRPKRWGFMISILGFCFEWRT